jgi:hypothetical protein
MVIPIATENCTKANAGDDHNTIHQATEQTVAGDHQGVRAKRLTRRIPKDIETPHEGKPPANRHVSP